MRARIPEQEYQISKRAFSAAEILALTTAPRAGAGTFASGIASQCGTTTLTGTGGDPALGNVTHGLTIGSSAVGSYSLFLGADRCPTSGGLIPLPIPASTGILGLTLYNQAVVYDAAQAKLEATYGWSLGVGN